VLRFSLEEDGEDKVAHFLPTLSNQKRALGRVARLRKELREWRRYGQVTQARGGVQMTFEENTSLYADLLNTQCGHHCPYGVCTGGMASTARSSAYHTELATCAGCRGLGAGWGVGHLGHVVPFQHPVLPRWCKRRVMVRVFISALMQAKAQWGEMGEGGKRKMHVSVRVA